VTVSRRGSTTALLAGMRRQIRRPKLLLLADLILVLALLALAYWLVGALLIPGFLADPARVPPFVVEAQLDPVRAVLVLGPLLVLAAVTEYRLRFPARARWPWTPLIVGWLGVAIGAGVVASPDFAASILLIGGVPAVLIGNNQGYLRRQAGLDPRPERWSRLRRVLTVIAAVVVVAWLALYLLGGILSAWQILDPNGVPILPPNYPRAPIGPGGGGA
jgi:hypothetical protein